MAVSISQNDREVLAALARTLKAYAGDPRYEARRARWRQLNGLRGPLERPVLWVRPDDDGGWLDLIPPAVLRTEDPDLRPVEMELRKAIYQHEHFDDDYVIEPVLRLVLPGEYTGYTYGDAGQPTAWGVAIQGKQASNQAYHLDNYLEDLENRARLLAHEVDFIEDEQRHALLREKVGQALDGVLPVQFTVPYGVLVQALLIELVHLRGLTELMLDIYDDPEGLHAILDHMSASKARLLLRLQEKGLLFDNQTNIYTGTGALGYLPPEDAPQGSVQLRHMWGTADAQEFSDVSPQAFREFALAYQRRGLNLFGYACYGCCEPLDHRIPMLFESLPRLRRISVSPWADVEVAARHIQGRAVYSWKPNPALVCGGFQEEALREAMLKVKETTETHGCHLEIILKDIRTCQGSPRELVRFAQLVHSIWP